MQREILTLDICQVIGVMKARRQVVDWNAD
jgi:hypothetical protein